jgi:hypothetical protein
MSSGLKAQMSLKPTLLDPHNNDDFSGFEMLDTAVKKARIIMTGENHNYVNFNAHLEMKMLRYLNRKTGLRHFIIELGEARAWYLNDYINGSDSATEKILKATTSPGYMDLFNRIKQYNTTLPDSAKIIIHGIDVERFYNLSILRFAQLLPKKNIPHKLASFVQTVDGVAQNLLYSGLNDYELAKNKNKKSGYSEYSRHQTYYYQNTAVDIVRYWDSLNTEFRNWLGSEFWAEDAAIGWLRQYLQWKKYENTTQQYIWREENIFRKFTKLLVEFPNEKFYGQFGRCHIAYSMQNGDCSWFGYHSVVNKLRTRYSKRAGDVLSIGIYYKGTGENAYYSDYESREDLSKEISELTDVTKMKTVSIFSLAGQNLPLIKEKFSFVIVNNRFESDAQKDSVKSEIEPVNTSIINTFYFSAFSVGITGGGPTPGKLNTYLNNLGFPANLQQKNWYKFGLHIVEEKNAFGINFNYRPESVVYNTDTGKLGYSAKFTNLEYIYFPFQFKTVQVGAGLQFGLGQETVVWRPENVNFTEVNRTRKFMNPVALGGIVMRAQTLVFQRMYLAVEAIRNFDLKVSQWKFDGSTLNYGKKNEITKGLGAYYFSFILGIKLDYDTNSYE